MRSPQGLPISDFIPAKGRHRRVSLFYFIQICSVLFSLFYWLFIVFPLLAYELYFFVLFLIIAL